MSMINRSPLSKPKNPNIAAPKTMLAAQDRALWRTPGDRFSAAIVSLMHRSTFAAR